MKAGKFTLDFSKPLIMGIMNMTPDSFFTKGRLADHEKAIDYGIKMAKDGADIIDIGGESTRPGANEIDEDTELSRVIPVIEKLSKMIDVPISVDTYKPVVAEAALKAGAVIINDVTGISDDNMAYIAKKNDCPVVIMHMQGKPKSMQQDPHYNDVVQDIITFFKERIKKAKFQGINKIILDPGIGFGKNLQHNLRILKNLKTFKALKYPLLLGTSRKSFIESITGAGVEDRLPGSISSALAGILNGANIVRVHDVAQTKQAIKIMEAIRDVNDTRI